MTDLYEILTELNIEIAYHHFSKPVVPPFIAYYRIESKNFVADDKVYEKINTYRIEIYTRKKNLPKPKRNSRRSATSVRA